MDAELMRFRADVFRKIRQFFWDRNFLELDTPALSPNLIPETCLEVFKTEYNPPSGPAVPLYLVPSPEIYIKRFLAQHPVPVFQLSKCYRNCESRGRIHSPEFTMLEYYITDGDYRDSALLTEELFDALLPPAPSIGKDSFAHLRPPFIRLTMDDAFNQYAGFRLSDCPSASRLAEKALSLGLYAQDPQPLQNWPWDDLYELILVQCVEPNLPAEKPVLLTDYPVQAACLAQDAAGSTPPLWKERWELYVQGMELANCYSEETDPQKVREYFEAEGLLKEKTALVPHAADSDYWKLFRRFPRCSGTAMGADRLAALLAGYKSIEPVLPFPLQF